MTPAQRELIISLIRRHPNEPRMRSEEFLARFPAADGTELSFSLLHEAIASRDSCDLAYAITVMFRFGVSAEHYEILKELCESDWHSSHEDVVDALEDLRSERTIECIYRMTHWIPSWVEDWQEENIPVKAVWALSKISSLKARDALERALQVVESPRLIDLINDRLSKSTVWDDL